MSAFSVPEANRFTFTVPGRDGEFSLPSMLDLAPEKMRAMSELGDLDTRDLDGINAFKEMLPSLADDGDDATAEAIRSLSTSQALALIQGYGEASTVSLGELKAS